MNWTEGTLYRHNRGRLRKVNPALQRQKEYFARARVRAIEAKAAEASLSQLVGSLSSQHSRASSVRSGSSSGRRRRNSHTPNLRKTQSGTKRPAVAPEPEDTPLPTISRFFQERAEGVSITAPDIQYDEAALERMRQKLLARKD
ncbi:hypothetical protein C8A05DRAFT_18134 [Staphylotrichum tortipilum]|uniref:Uncharacterized protein n=1 Tax=Staphylotrichum tortipilum TaxID=2831512 RepID=A0AAN6MFU9_9PEZI|nr:hypothetical protein C8A05DRAFT_18134 [Staphylotrichum longicolle]